MLWKRKAIDAELIPVSSVDLTAAVLRLADREVMVVSVYVEGKNEAALTTVAGQLRILIH